MIGYEHDEISHNYTEEIKLFFKILKIAQGRTKTTRNKTDFSI